MSIRFKIHIIAIVLIIFASASLAQLTTADIAGSRSERSGDREWGVSQA